LTWILVFVCFCYPWGVYHSSG